MLMLLLYIFLAYASFKMWDDFVKIRAEIKAEKVAAKAKDSDAEDT